MLRLQFLWCVEENKRNLCESVGLQCNSVIISLLQMLTLVLSLKLIDTFEASCAKQMLGSCVFRLFMNFSRLSFMAIQMQKQLLMNLFHSSGLVW